MRYWFSLCAGTALLAAAQTTWAFEMPRNQIQIEPRIVETDTWFFKEIGVDFDFSVTDSIEGSTDLVPLRDGGQPTGDTLFQFDSDRIGPDFGIGVDAVTPAFDLFGLPTVFRIGAGARGGFASGSDDSDAMAVPPGLQAGFVSLDGTQFNAIVDPTDINFETREQRTGGGIGVALQTALGSDVQLQTGLEAGVLAIEQMLDLELLTQNNPISDETRIDSLGGQVMLNVTPIITVGDRVDLFVGAEAGALLLGNTLERTRVDNQVATESSDSSTSLSGVFGGRAGVNVRPFGTSRTTVGVEGGIRHFTNLPILGTAFRDGEMTSLGSGSRTELMVFVKARILLYSEDE